MSVAALVTFALATVMYVAWSERLGRSHLTAPMIFTVVGAGAGVIFTHHFDPAAVRNLAELTLALVLFHDAAQIQPRQLRGDIGVCLRLLLLALPLTIAAGFGMTRVLFPGMGAWLALLVAAALAPTDAGLGAATVLNPVVPVRIRRVLNVESGLNDGLSTPVVLLALAAAGGLGERHIGTALVELLIGVVVGLVLGAVSGHLLSWANAVGLVEAGLIPVGTVAVPLLCYYGAVALDGNGFVAAFVSGTAFAAAFPHRRGANSTEEPLLLAGWGASILGYAVWFLFGVIVVSRIGDLVTWPAVALALLSLTVLRMVPVALVLLGTGFARPTRWFVGWFGPRGLASVVFGLLAAEQLPPDSNLSAVTGAIALTVLLSVGLHGVTADAGARRYGAWTVKERPAAELAVAIEPVAGRGRNRP